jgi:uncharacterized protein (DUF169 family)
MTDWRGIEQRLTDAIGPRRRPVAVAFRTSPPTGVPRFAGRQPSGCSFWRLAAEGHGFYTVPADHANCAIGSYTHNMPVEPARARELEDTLGFMTGLGYLQMEEVPGIPRLPETPAAVVYAPLGETPVEPDVVLVAGQPGRLMLLFEAATRAGVPPRLPLLGRPTCMALPAALAGGPAMSLGCVGNRVYTGLDEDELYVALPGHEVVRVVAELATIASANATLADYHARRRAELATEA